MTHVPDKEHRKTVVNAVKGIASGKVSFSMMIHCERSSLMTQTHVKKRTKDSDLMQPLSNGADDSLPASLEIKEILDPEVRHSCRGKKLRWSLD